MVVETNDCVTCTQTNIPTHGGIRLMRKIEQQMISAVKDARTGAMITPL